MSWPETHHSPGFFGFFRRDFSKMARARVSCPIFSSSRESKSHRGVEWGHFFSCGQDRQVRERGLGWDLGGAVTAMASSSSQSQAAHVHGDPSTSRLG